MRFTDGKDVSRTIRMGFTIYFQFHTALGNLRKDALSWTKPYMRAPWLGFCYIHFGQFDVKTSIFGTFTVDTVYV